MHDRTCCLLHQHWEAGYGPVGLPPQTWHCNAQCRAHTTSGLMQHPPDAPAEKLRHHEHHTLGKLVYKLLPCKSTTTFCVQCTKQVLSYGLLIFPPFIVSIFQQGMRCQQPAGLQCALFAPDATCNARQVCHSVLDIFEQCACCRKLGPVLHLRCLCAAAAIQQKSS